MTANTHVMRIHCPFFAADALVDDDTRCIRELTMLPSQPLVGWNIDLLRETLERACGAGFGQPKVVSIEEP